jgi:DNA excision repair protein ERCC-2
MKAENYRASRTAPKTLYGMLWRICFHLSDMLDSIPVGPIRKSILDFFFEARFFLTVLEQFFDSTYVFACRISESSPVVTSENISLTLFLSCLDASGKIHDQIADKHSCVFFSATLSPIEYYRAMLLGEDWSLSETLHIESPFAPENLKVVISSQIRTVFRERSFTSSEIAHVIASSISSRKGNYIAYFPSFKYMNLISNIINNELGENRKIKIIIQNNEMTLTEKAEFLNHFESFGERTLLAFAVLGGHFGEGIDLVGEKLNGVFIVGVGIPQISPEREILRQYYQEKFGDGYAYAYRFPGWEKVFQASGRVIRDENDKGFVVLMDHRYDLAEYKVLFPDHWIANYAESTSIIPSMIVD